MIDSHCHLADDAFAADAEAVIDRARDAGLTRVLCILEGGNQTEEERALRLSHYWPDLRSAVGVHPHIAGRFAGRVDDVVETVRTQIGRIACTRAVGEIGLDYHYDHSPRDVQRDVFAAQVRLATELNLPVVIHTREADDDTISILRDEGRGRLRGVMHCFTGDTAMAKRSLDLGFHLSFAGIVTFPRAVDLRETARLIAVDRLLVETDAPYLAPVPHRGKRNEPAWVRGVLNTLAEVRGSNPTELADQVTRNFVELFRP